MQRPITMYISVMHVSGFQEGVGGATLFASFFLGYALAFWYGTKLVADDIRDGCESNCATGVREA